MKTILGDETLATLLIAGRISDELNSGKKVLWLIPGGSNISISARAFEMIRNKVTPEILKRLSVILTDERYVPVGHKDSNWQQFIKAGFNFDAIRSVPVLKNLTLEETVSEYERNFKLLSDEADIVIGQFGIGSDSHIAGALPGSPAIETDKTVVAYEAPQFTRITLTLPALKNNTDVAFGCVFGVAKRDAVHDLETQETSLDKAPAQILKSIKDSYLISDQVER